MDICLIRDAPRTEAAVAREVEQARREGIHIRVPSYVVVVEDATDTPDAGSASRPPA